MTTRKKPHTTTPKRHRHLPHRNFYEVSTGEVHWCECGAIQYRRNVGYELRWHSPKGNTKEARAK